MNQSSLRNTLIDQDFQLKRDEIRKSEVSKWIDANQNARYSFGRNIWGEKIVEQYKNLGFYVENEVNGWGDSSDLKTLHALSLPIGVLPITALRKAQKLSLSAVDLLSLIHLTRKHEIAPDFIRGMDQDVLINNEWYVDLMGRFADTFSVRIFKSLMNFRASWDIHHLSGFSDKREMQYLETFLQLNKEDVYYDVGAYTGDSYSSFVNFFGEFRSSFLFEPSLTNFRLMQENIPHNNKLNLFNLGLSNESGKFNLSLDGSHSHLIDDGGESFEAIKLDDLDITPPTFIKIDIEGMEEKFLEGAQKTLETYRPKIAIAVYHNPFQLRNIVNVVENIMPRSKFYLRHYTEGFSETILYVVPE